MILCDRQIRQLCLEKAMIAPFDESLLNSHSLDIRIGNHAQLLTRAKGFIEIDLSNYSEESPLKLQPSDRMLVSSLEIFNMPANVCGQFVLKSSRAREYYNHILAGWIDGHFTNSNLTMELKNESYFELPIFTGLKIGQIVFYQTETPDASYQKRGRYNDSKGAVVSKDLIISSGKLAIFKAITSNLIRQIISRRLR